MSKTRMSRSRLGWIVTVHPRAISKFASEESQYIIIQDLGNVLKIRGVSDETGVRSVGTFKIREHASPRLVPFSCIKTMIKDLKETMSIEEMLTHENESFREVGKAILKSQQ